MMSLRFFSLAFIASGSLFGDAGGAETPASQSCQSAAAGWSIIETANFRFCARSKFSLPPKTLSAVEELRDRLTAKWSGKPSGGIAWQPKCDVILHGTRAAYLRAVPGGGKTLGSSVIDVANDAVIARRIDIRADQPGWFDGVLAHELTHLVLADLFPGSRVPAWADEGMAVLADPAGKQDAHLRDLWLAHSQRGSFRLTELLAMEDYPSPDRHAAFYGQSASLVQYLVERGTPEQFVQFVQTGVERGYEQALRDIYRLNGVAELEHRWRQHANAVGALAVRERRLNVD
ncbi:MAG TPA: hypothetical protein VFW87_19465 [Pirellulales bacterium]|nr:hypothetical protein [Pirellulales bacterium]